MNLFCARAYDVDKLFIDLDVYLGYGCSVTYT